VHEVVIELAVRVVPQLVVRVHDRPVEVEHFHRLDHVRREDVHRRADVVLERSGGIVEVHPDEAAEGGLGPHLPQRRVLLAETVLIALLGARDFEAAAAGIV
jgi:hypothetical protein